jgi:hypothetical protein
VLFFDLGGDGKLTDQREYVFTEWASGDKDDMAALRRAFDANGDGKLTSADARSSEFKVLVANSDGTRTAQKLARLEVGLRLDRTKVTQKAGLGALGATAVLATVGRRRRERGDERLRVKREDRGWAGCMFCVFFRYAKRAYIPWSRGVFASADGVAKRTDLS